MAHTELRPVCFMVMPFRIKKVTGPTGEGAPKEIDCDILWNSAFRPAIEDAGYTAVRADFETGSVIVKDMLERLAFADLVLADVSLPNGNVYYEVGLRHVACETGCILFAASWSRQLFDIEQFTSVRYELSDGHVPDAQADKIRSVVRNSIDTFKSTRTPWYEFIGVDGQIDQQRTVFRDSAAQLSAFQAAARATRLSPDKDKRKADVKALRDGLPPAALEIADVAVEMLHLVRDELGWQETVDFAESLPEAVARLPSIQEQRLLALAEIGEPETAIASLQELNKLLGNSPERLGLIGGRFKRLWRAAREERMAANSEHPSRQERRFLARAIEAYSDGMELDLNEYYCSCNIAQLLLAREDEGDAEKAISIDHVVVAACERAIARNEDDEWTRPTLLGAAFRARNVGKAEELAMRIDEDGVDAWKLKATIADLDSSVDLASGTPEVVDLKRIVDDLKALVAEEDG